VIHKVREGPDTFRAPDSVAQDKSLSWGAKGLYLYILSRPVTTPPSVSMCVEASPAGDTRCRTLARELEEKGYIRREESRHPIETAQGTRFVTKSRWYLTHE
jgi:hypothetical protein